jgi:dihydrofolate reductase
MRKLVVTEFVSLDGVMEAPGGEPGHPHSGWVMEYMGDEQGRVKFEEVIEAEAHLLGRVTYESFAESWPQREGPFAEKINSMPKHVVTSTLDELEWENSTRLEGDVVESVRKLKQEDGGPILVAGSRTLVHTLLANGLVDELRLMVFPVVLGSGDRVFPESRDKIVLDLIESRSFDNGVQVNSYRPG